MLTYGKIILFSILGALLLAIPLSFGVIPAYNQREAEEAWKAAQYGVYKKPSDARDLDLGKHECYLTSDTTFFYRISENRVAEIDLNAHVWKLYDLRNKNKIRYRIINDSTRASYNGPLIANHGGSFEYFFQHYIMGSYGEYRLRQHIASLYESIKAGKTKLNSNRSNIEPIQFGYDKKKSDSNHVDWVKNYRPPRRIDALTSHPNVAYF